MTKTVWLSNDLGVREVYEGLFQFPDQVNAKECGSNLGVFSFQVKNDLLTELKEELQQHMEIGKRSRIYAMYAKSDGKLTGKFIFGNRKSPPWTGYGAVGDEENVASE